MKINDYIDFEKLFLDCIKENKDYMYDYQNDNIIYTNVLNFYNNGKLQFPIDAEESELRDDVIIFVFSEDYNDANESNNQSSWSSVQIVYNRNMELFTDYEYEAG